MAFPLKRTRVVEFQRSRSSNKSPRRSLSYNSDDGRAVKDCIATDLDVLFCGINPGIRSAETRSHFAHPSNSFWKCLHRSGFTKDILASTADVTLPEQCNIGITNLVQRSSPSAADLSQDEMRAGVPVLLKKVAKYHPRILAFVGIGMYKTFLRTVVEKSKQTSALSCGLQELVLKSFTEMGSTYLTLVFVVPSTSGLVTHYKLDDKVKYFRLLKEAAEKTTIGKQVVDVENSVVIDIG